MQINCGLYCRVVCNTRKFSEPPNPRFIIESDFKWQVYGIFLKQKLHNRYYLVMPTSKGTKSTHWSITVCKIGWVILDSDNSVTSSSSLGWFLKSFKISITAQMPYISNSDLEDLFVIPNFCLGSLKMFNFFD